MRTENFWKYCGVQGVLALLLVLGVLWLALSGQQIPETLATLAAAAAAFYFGSKGGELSRGFSNWSVRTSPQHKVLVRDFESVLSTLANIRQEKPDALNAAQVEELEQLVAKWWE